ncbi:hypothetical protein E2C01_087524 [Portunus trituberculatus]|uniref:Uncharacterized protein n=1 Tax=Portunus trituberculatus TaxID=210409 RepID=A0A5B7JE96_PORTR|nr:hypothetical protein [Portunus trituberculatus]
MRSSISRSCSISLSMSASIWTSRGAAMPNLRAENRAVLPLYCYGPNTLLGSLTTTMAEQGGN